MIYGVEEKENEVSGEANGKKERNSKAYEIAIETELKSRDNETVEGGESVINEPKAFIVYSTLITSINLDSNVSFVS